MDRLTNRLVVPYGEGGRITVDPRDPLQEEILRTGFYEPEVWDALNALAVDGETVWDVGAHIGSFAIRALTNPKVKELHAFEPDRRHHRALQVNLAMNRGRFTIHRVALSSRKHAKRLYHGPASNTGASTLVPWPNREVSLVQCCSADELVFEKKIPAPTLLKIDVEGWEEKVLSGARQLFKKYPPKAVVVEAAYGGNGKFPPEVQRLEKLGYLARRIPRWPGAIHPRENYLAVRARS